MRPISTEFSDAIARAYSLDKLPNDPPAKAMVTEKPASKVEVLQNEEPHPSPQLGLNLDLRV